MPKAHLPLSSSGTGIDAIWCVNGCAHNDGKPFAIVDAKASVSGKNPKYMSKPGNTRKPGISRLLDGSGRGRNRVVQMSHEWIEKNIDRAAPRDATKKITRKSPDGSRAYSRHILYTPPYSDSLLKHLGATFENSAAELHDEHATIQNSEVDVKSAINRAKLRERKTGKHSGAEGLMEEKQ